MTPSFLRDALEVWLRNGTKKGIREAATKAYAKNQKNLGSGTADSFF
ncbi:MAG: hypothetical protein P8H96_14075 [Akkermansiaceae bacterium]|nr:hypothetical protein [Akkermansiaceae bacterium]